MFVFFCCWKRRKEPQKMIIGISGVGCFCPKMAVSWRITVFFPTMPCWNPCFYCVLGCALSGPSCQKKRILGHPPENRKFWLIIEKLFFWYFCVFLHFLHLFFFFLLFFVGFVFFVLFLGGFKGQVRWPEWPPHLALNPRSCFVCFVFFCFVFFCFFFVGFLLVFFLRV